MLIVSSWDGDHPEIADTYRKLGIKSTFFPIEPQGHDDFEIGILGCVGRKQWMEDKLGRTINGFAYTKDVQVEQVKAAGFLYGRTSCRWHFTADKTNPLKFPVHVTYDSKYFWDVYRGQRDHFIFSGTSAPDLEDRLKKMLDDGHRFMGMEDFIAHLDLWRIL